MEVNYSIYKLMVVNYSKCRK